MKKLLVFSAISAMSFGAFAQGKHEGNKNHGNEKGNEMRKEHHDNDNDEHGDHGNGKMKKNDEASENDRDNSNNNRGKMTNHAPRKVMDAFQRDYPNSGGATWTKDRGVWTATFKNGGIFGGARTVSYRANGQRIASTRPFR